MEFLVCKQDLGNYGLGDIIDIHPDGFAWGRDELVSDRLQVVRIPNDEVGLTVANARIAFLPIPLYHCEGCDVYLESSEVTTHIEANHADEMWADQAHTVRKPPTSLGINTAFQTKFRIDLVDGAILERKPGTDPSQVTLTTRADTNTMTIL